MDTVLYPLFRYPCRLFLCCKIELGFFDFLTKLTLAVSTSVATASNSFWARRTSSSKTKTFSKKCKNVQEKSFDQTFFDQNVRPFFFGQNIFRQNFDFFDKNISMIFSTEKSSAIFLNFFRKPIMLSEIWTGLKFHLLTLSLKLPNENHWFSSILVGKCLI